MGIFYIDCEVVHVAKPAKRVTVAKLLVAAARNLP